MRAFVVTVAPDEAELVSDVLFGLGVLAVEERTSDAGTIELWTHVGDDEQAIAAVTSAVAERWPVRTVEVDDAVTETWREFATPCEIAPGLVVMPSWIEPPPYGSEVLVVPIDPGAAFGLGDHPTTVLTLRALWQLAEADPDRRGLVGRAVLDVGSGSGVLAVTAALLGADPVEAIDIHHAAVEATLENASRNGVSVVAGSTPLAEVTGSFDVVLANVLAPALIELAPDLVRVTALGGTLVTSGVLDGRFDHVVAALAPLVVQTVSTVEGWAAVVLRNERG